MILLQTRFVLDDFVLAMRDISPSQLQLNQLQDWFSRLELNDDLLKPHIVFSDQTYQRSLICRTARFDLLALCWQPGQASTIHDHLDSLNVTRVYRGQLTSRLFAAAPQWATVTLAQTDRLQPNDLVTVDRHQIHQLANTTDEPLITLHVYARPLQAITVYCPTSGRSERVTVPSLCNNNDCIQEQ